MENLMRNRWMVLALLGAVLALGFGSGRHWPAPSLAHAQTAPSVSFTSVSGAASDTWLVSFSGFGAAEVVDIAFLDPTGTPVLVGGGSVFYASAQADGSGAFNFVPAQWLLPVSLTTLTGTWTVVVRGETSGIVVTVAITIV